ncbi:phospholipase/carboxylesterase [Grosmannia clavigera kw1407]|uniref:Phospholipase/carboxylesterase n=1 Tax=Grosmannia clavigera (strain kw1407 / UAMH 11150) TaxID=655863 RepID=F0X9C7_GROCL|nr:phospholipase/carboxylesterase [Grosmannia clavigera kw1407]EFX05468.1 phospholipase/carboxylesterase [Grosmannia clavigera kw1407]
MVSGTFKHGPANGYKHTHTIIFLHGRGSNADEFAGELFESEASADTTQPDQDLTIPAMSPNIRWVFPQAPILRSERFDTEMSQWFDMWSVENPEEQSELQRDGLKQSMKTILDTVHTEEKILPRDHIFLAGISQRFATALATMLAEGQGGFSGVLGLSSWMPFANKAEKEIANFSQENDGQLRLFTALRSLYGNEDVQDDAKQASPTTIKATPIFLAHALDDNVVPVENGERMQHILRDAGLTVEWHKYADGGHWVNEPEGVDDILRFLKRCMSFSDD